MKIQAYITALLVSLCAVPAQGQEWQEIGSDHFLVYYTGDRDFAQEVSHKAEGYYVGIASDLGYPRYSEFWTWENRVKIYIYPDRESFLRASGQPSWSEGMADYTNKRIMSFTHSQGFVDSILPHEMAHLIFRDFVGFKGEVPVWLDEGVAQWAEPLKRRIIKAVSRNILDKGTFFSVEDMVKLDIRGVTNTSVVRIHSIRGADGTRSLMTLNGDVVVKVYYIEAISLVGFLIDHYGASSFTEFCRQLRDGKSLADALKFAYPMRVTSVDELENAWLEYLRGP